MQKQEYNIIIQENIIQISKNSEPIYEVSLTDKSINLKALYDKMQVNIDDEYKFATGLEKFDTAQNDAQRIFNNVYEFISSLITALNGKLKELRERQDTSIFR